MDYAIKIEGLSKNFGNLTALKGVSFVVRKGMCFGVVGPNGAGKTTLLNVLMGFVVPDSGYFEVNGIKAGNFRRIKKEIGFIAQEEILDEELSVFQNLYLHAVYYDIPRREARKRAEELLKFFEIDRKDEPVKNLSGGMKKKVAIAKALIHNPEILIMDEPTIGLDPSSRRTIWEIISVLSKGGKTILLTTHYMDEAEKLCDEVAIMHRGEIIEMGPPLSLISTHLPPVVLEVKVNSDKERKELTDYLSQKELSFKVSGNLFTIFSRHADTIRGELLLLGIENIFKRGPNLEDLFLKLTGREMEEK